MANDCLFGKGYPSVSNIEQQISALEGELSGCMLRDYRRLRHRLRDFRRDLRANRHVSAESVAALGAEISRSCERVMERRRALPVPRFPDELPVVACREAIAAAIRNHQVVVVAGETGSGKTTQLPKICLELGRGVRGLIGHTQPRRIAARSVASRIASELRCEPGSVVGYKVRFRDRVGPDTYIKLMTDGILLAEIQGDRYLEQYDTLIIDEAHERSLNIDFLLGYLKQLLPRRPDLKVIITSATIDTQRFSRHFGAAPVIEVSGRTWPVEIRYRPLSDGEQDARDRDLQQAILDAVDELASVGSGDILVFLSGEREICETAEVLRKHHPPHTEILPLYARLSAAEQSRVFSAHSGRRVVLATNVAETSLTVPGIRYVIDTGLARISRYSCRSKVQRLPVERISRASANQRSGRCGRVAEGVAIRLYSEQEYLERPEFTEPEILRTNLASVILTMSLLGLGKVEQFPFVDPPEQRQINDGYRLLQELGAMDGERRITPLGRRLARLPVDPRIGRMVLAAGEEGCLREVLIIAAALTVQDPRERPQELRQKADEAHRQYRDEHSDFLTLLNLWECYQEHRRHLSHNKLRRYCRDRFLSLTRMREWQEIHSQLLTLARQMELRPNRQRAGYDAIHRALLAGLLGNIAVRTDESIYQGARNIRLSLFPGSGLFRKRPKWIMAAQLVETSRLYAHCVARIDPAWVEPLAGELLKRSYSEPYWQKRSARVVARLQLSLYGLIIVAGRRVDYGSVDAKEARAIFIREALVRGAYHTRAPFFHHNRRLIEEVEQLEHKSRRNDVLVDEEALFSFYDARIPSDVCTGARFERWRKRAERDTPRLLYLSREELMRHAATHICEHRFPDQLVVDGVRLPLSYHFEPGHPRDGVTVVTPLELLNQLHPDRFEWLVPALLEEKITLLLRGLPKAIRRNFVPVPDYARACVEAMQPGDGALLEALSAHLHRISGERVPLEMWSPQTLPDHLRMNFRVVDEKGESIAEGRELAVLQRSLGSRARASFSSRIELRVEREGITCWDFGTLPEMVEFQQRGVKLRGYPALLDQQESVAIKVFDTRDAADRAMRSGIRRLFLLTLGDKSNYLQRRLPVTSAMCMHYLPLGSCEDLREDLITAICDRVFIGDEPPVRDAAAFARRQAQARKGLMECANQLCTLVEQILLKYHTLGRRLGKAISPAWIHSIADIREQLSLLIPPGFVTTTPWEWLQQLPRYLSAIEVRLEKLQQGRVKQDAAAMREFRPLWERYLDHREQVDSDSRDARLEEYRWLLEELRVSLFAQRLGTIRTVSVKRLSAWFG